MFAFFLQICKSVSRLIYFSSRLTNRHYPIATSQLQNQKLHWITLNSAKPEWQKTWENVLNLQLEKRLENNNRLFISEKRNFLLHKLEYLNNTYLFLETINRFAAKAILLRSKYRPNVPKLQDFSPYSRQATIVIIYIVNLSL